MKKESAEYGVDVTNEATAPVKGLRWPSRLYAGMKRLRMLRLVTLSGNQAHCADCRCQTCSI